MLPLLATAMGLGLAYAALPGVVNAEALRRGVARGFRPALLVHVGALLGAAAWAGVALSGAAVLVRNNAAATALGLIGAAFLFNLARTALVGAMEPSAPNGGGVGVGRSDLSVGMIVSIANPAGLPFWLGLSGGLFATSGERDAGAGEVALVLLGVMAGSFLWGCTMAVLVNWGRRFVGARFFRWVNGLCGVAFAYFGVRMLWSAVRRLT